MPSQSLTIHVPEPLYQHLRRRADQMQRSVEEETLELLANAVPDKVELPQELTEAITSMQMMDDSSLWNAAQSRMPAEAVNDLEELNAKQRQNGLSATEADALAALVRQYERYMLVRAKPPCCSRSAVTT